MNFNYVFMPIIIFVAGVLIIWLSSRRILALSKKTYQAWRKKVEQAVLSIVILVALAIAGYTAFNAIAVRSFWSRNPAPGKLVDVDGHRMHIDCAGSGSPTLILEAGGENDSTVWNGVQPALSKTTRVCSYDRAGFGWSDTRPTDPRVLTVGVWTNTRPLTVLDLSKFPAIPEFYRIPRYDRDPIVFLNHFVEEIRNPVKHDGHEHIDYVPTQILTEYLQRSYRALDNRPLDGIIYKSAQRRRGRSIVIFASHSDLDPDGFLTWGGGQPILKLDPASVRKVKRGY